MQIWGKIIPYTLIIRVKHWFNTRSTIIPNVHKVQYEKPFKTVKHIPDSDFDFIQSGLTSVGGGYSHARVMKFDYISPFIISGCTQHSKNQRVEFVDHLDIKKAKEKYGETGAIICNMPLHLLVSKLLQENLRGIAKQHNVFLNARATKKQIAEVFKYHDYHCDHKYTTVFTLYCKSRLGTNSLNKIT
jgi:hypothetical protein